MGFAGLVAAALVGGTGLIAQPPPQLPLTIITCAVEPHDKMRADSAIVRCEVRNDGRKTIVALAIAYDLRLPDGTTHKGGFGTDSAHTQPTPLRTSVIAPGGSAVLPQGGGVVVAADAVVTGARVTFVIFDDDTALGDEKEIAFFFQRRRDHQSFWHAIDAIFSEATTRANDPEAIFALMRARMESDGGQLQEANGGWYAEILARMTPRRMELTQTTPQYVLETLRTGIAEQKALCDQHLERRY